MIIKRDRAVRPLFSYAAVFAMLCAMIVAAPVPARADAGDAGAKSFIQTSVDRGIAILKNKTISATQERQQIRDLLSSILDTKKIGLFALGAVRAKASPAELSAYVAAFNDFMIESYVTRLSGYGGQSIKVIGVLDHAPGDYVVRSILVDPSSPDDSDPIHIDFRVLKEGDKYAIVDASIAGIWLGLAQRDAFNGFLGQHNDSVPVLTAHLKEMTARFENQKSAAN